MKILHIISQHAESTGSACYLQNILRESQKVGYRNFLIAAISNGVRPQLDMLDEKYCRFLEFCLPPLSFPVPGMSDIMPYSSSHFGTLAESQLNVYQDCWRDIISTAILDFNPDIIHSHHLWIMSSVARECSYNLSIPHIISCHSNSLRQFCNYPQLQERALPCAQAERILASSEKQKQKIISLYNIADEKVQIVGESIDITRFRVSRKKEYSKSPLQLLYAGKLSFAKGVKLLLDTVAQFQQEDLHLHIAGSGSGDEGIRCLQQANYLQERGLVTVHGRLKQDDLAVLMQQCHAFVLPSFDEGLPLVLLKALACGCRIICTDLPGSINIVGDSNGKGVESGLVEIIPLVRVVTLDNQKDEDYALLQKRLRQGIQKTIQKINNYNEDDKVNSKLEQVRQEILARNSWAQVFTRIATVYRQFV